jgi:hypothetical protein
MHVFACILSVLCIKCMRIRICSELLLHVTVCLNSSRARQRAAAARLQRCRRWGKFVARAAQSQANNEQIYLDRVRSTDSCSRRQLEQQRICCALKRLGAVGYIDEQNNNSSLSIRQPLLRQQSWISLSTYTQKSKHRKSTQTSKTLL